MSLETIFSKIQLIMIVNNISNILNFRVGENLCEEFVHFSKWKLNQIED
jgi:hypothetical protein